MTLLLTGAALLLLFGSYLVIRALIDADGIETQAKPRPITQPSDDARQHRRAA